MRLKFEIGILNGLLALAILITNSHEVAGQQASPVILIDENGGASGYGQLLHLDDTQTTFEAIYDFPTDIVGRGPVGSLLEGNDGFLYGMTSGGGKYNAGVIYSYNYSSNEYTILHEFDGCTGGKAPYGGVQMKNGILYGVAGKGGEFDFGIIFCYNLSSNQFVNLHDFNGVEGKYPETGIVIRGDAIYGTTNYGGVADKGILYSFDLINLEFQKEVDFNGANGSMLHSALTLAEDSLLYGTTSQGGQNDLGVLFRFDVETDSIISLFDFDGINGMNPAGKLLSASNGLLYGMARGGVSNYGFGVIFTYNIFENTFSKVYDFSSYALRVDGANSLIQGNDGNLYTCQEIEGNLIKYNPLLNMVTSVFSFNSTSSIGSFPNELIQALDGRIYGTCMQNNNNIGGGFLFSWDFDDELPIEEFEFNSNQVENPNRRLVRADNGRFYGMSLLGGANNMGTIFSIDEGFNQSVVEFSFDMASGYFPMGSLLLANDNYLYGLHAYGGGVNQSGCIFRFNPESGEYAILFEFDSYVTGNGGPSGSLIQATNGKLYGLLNGNYGSIFSFDLTDFEFEELYVFDGFNGAFPLGSLVEASNGRLYGFTYRWGSNGPSDGGVMFSFDPSNNSFVKLFDIAEALDIPIAMDYGVGPKGNLIEGLDGALYGVTTAGDSLNRAVLFKFLPQYNQIIRLLDFNVAPYIVPLANTFADFIDNSLVMSPSGKLYGITFTYSRGQCNPGFIYCYDPSNNSFEIVNDFGVDVSWSNFHSDYPGNPYYTNSGNGALGGINYQAMLREADSSPAINSNVALRFSLLPDSIGSSPEYVETHTLVTNQFGIISTAVGIGTPEMGSFQLVDWTNGNKYLKVEVDRGSGFVEIGNEKIWSVPYAMHSATTGTIKNPGLPVFSDNAAALAGGLLVGDMYRTASGQLKIVY